MVSLTENEAKTMEFLARNFSRDYNINQLAKMVGVSPGGMFKILKKLERQKFLTGKKRGNNIFYKIHYDSQDALDACAFALGGRKITPYVSSWIKDVERLKPKTGLAILFGSIINKGKEARDVDILLVFGRRNLKDIEDIIGRINRMKSKRIHAVYQTEEDLVKNIKKQDKAILEEIRTGIILWGRGVLVEAIKHGQD